MPGRGDPSVSSRTLRVVIIAWASFAVASIATAFFFAAFDPVALAEAATFPVRLGRTAGYTLGFFCFWLIALSASAFSVFLIRSMEQSAHRPQ
ncbi:MAG TPA: hypothetical protein VKZ99_11045 [Gammaproteobacteria bacterium]|nr:hypothetical protein [Gammaproteobacteria bacterium]